MKDKNEVSVQTTEEVKVEEAVVVKTNTAVTTPAIPRNEMEQLQLLIDSKSLPSNIKNISQAYTIAEFGKNLGMKPMQAFHQIYNINGRLALSSKALGGLLWANGIKFKTIQDFVKFESGKDKDNKPTYDWVTEIEFYRYGITDRAEFKWSDAKRAEWTTKDNWIKMPRHMMYARCLAMGANRIAPDKIMGLYTVEEMVNVTDVKNVAINEEGEVTIKQ